MGNGVRERGMKCSAVALSTWYLELVGSTIVRPCFCKLQSLESWVDLTPATMISAKVSVAGISVRGCCNGRNVHHLLSMVWSALGIWVLKS